MAEDALAPRPRGGLPNIVSHEQKAAAEMAAAKGALDRIRELAEETLQTLRKQRASQASLDESVEGVCAVFGCEARDLSLEDRERIADIITHRPLTEIAHGRKVSMSDRTAISLEASLIKQWGGQAKEVFELLSASYYPEALVRSLVGRMLMLVELKFKTMVDGQVWDQFVREVTDICDDVSRQQKGGRV